jgi:hypothetical protein
MHLPSLHDHRLNLVTSPTPIVPCHYIEQSPADSHIQGCGILVNGMFVILYLVKDQGKRVLLVYSYHVAATHNVHRVLHANNVAETGSTELSRVEIWVLFLFLLTTIHWYIVLPQEKE